MVMAWSRQAIACALLAAGLAAPALITAQEPSASVLGRVLTADRTGAPVPRAIVSVMSSDARVRRSDTTDDQGRFTISGLPPGRYTVSASKPEYLTAVHGARRPGRPGTPIALAAGERVNDLILSLARGAVVSGIVRDAAGAPVPNLRVTVLAAAAFSEPRAPFLAATGVQPVRPVIVTTNHRGTYRAFGLPPGEYVISAAPPSLMSREGPVARPSSADVDATLALLERTAGGAAASSMRGASKQGYAQIFFPGTPLAHEAGRIHVGAGDLREGLDFIYDMVPVATVTAAIVWPAGVPRDILSLALVPIDVTPLGAVPLTPQLGAGDGLTYSGVPPGRYLLTAGAGDGPEAWASQELLVDGADISGVTLVLQPTMTMSGRVVTGNASERRLNVARAQVTLTRSGTAGRILRNDRPSGPRTAPQAEEAAEQPFTVAGIVPGVYSVSVVLPDGPTGGWWLESAVAGGRELLDAPLEFGTTLGSVDDAVLTVTDRRSGLTGRLQTPAGVPATEHFVIVFSADRAQWFPGARRTRAVRPATDGVFSVGELPAGAYLVAAVTDAYPDEWQRADFLGQLASFAVPVTIRAGETVRQDLQIAGR
jgi:protocatechuate 3,4-dioxygenase beta subunit